MPRILVVDDQPGVADSLEFILRAPDMMSQKVFRGRMHCELHPNSGQMSYSPTC
jgi:DNA-binding response OmpR family regulator